MWRGSKGAKFSGYWLGLGALRFISRKSPVCKVGQLGLLPSPIMPISNLRMFELVVGNIELERK